MNKVAIASCWGSLDDLLKMDICTGNSIYCQFPLGQLGLCEIEGIKRQIRVIGITEITFNDGSRFGRESLGKLLPVVR